MADQTEKTAPQSSALAGMDEPLNLLALDGGGIRGVSMLLILDQIMERIKLDKGLAEPPRPCEHFHLIGGTSAGGYVDPIDPAKESIMLNNDSLIALMLGRLRMTTREALQKYNEIAGSVFCKSNRKSFRQEGSFKATTLEKQIQSLVAEKVLGEDMSPERDEVAAKTFVCTVPATNMAHPRLFRSYTVRENASINSKIWEAARATTAAPTFFKRITIVDDGGAREDFLDGGLRFNNPANLVLSEAFTVFGGASKLGCLVSLGTGHPGTIGLSQPDAFQKILPTEMIGVLKRIATNCEQTAHELAQRFRELPTYYFRYNVSHGVGSISLEEWRKMNEVQGHTKAYLQEVEVSSSINKLVDILCGASEIQRPEVSMQSICLAVPQSVTEPTSGLLVKWPLKVLILSSDPRTYDRLCLEEEHQGLQLAIRKTRFASSIKVDNEPSCQYSDIAAALDRFNPHILHFSGLGEEDVLYFEDAEGIPKPVQKQALASMLRYQKELQLVILNACDSLDHGQAFANAVGLAIVSEGILLDQDAIDFSREFYTALGYGQRSYIEAFGRAKSAVEMTGRIKLHLLQREISRMQDDPATSTFVPGG